MLNKRQIKFAQAYCKGMCKDAKAAALEAGYSLTTAENASSWLNPKSREKFSEELVQYIAELNEKIDNETIADIRELRQELTKIVRNQATETVLAYSGEGIQEEREVKPSTKDRLKAIELLGKAEGMFDNKLDVNMDTEIHIVREYVDATELQE